MKKLRVNPNALAERFMLELQEVQSSGDWQLILPKGEFHTRRYGAVNIDEKFLADLVGNWRSKAFGQRQPFVDVDHEGGEAQGWIKELQATDRGLEVKIDWTDAGKDKLTRQLYKYFSATIGDAIDQKTGEQIFPVLVGAALTNQPQMYMLPPAKLSDPHSDDPEGRGEEDDMEFKEIVAALKKVTPEQKAELLEALGGVELSEEMTDEQKAQVAEKLGLKLVDKEEETVELDERVSKLNTEVEGLRDANKTLSLSLKKINDDQRKRDIDQVIELSEREGRTIPKDRPKWRKRLEASFETTKEIMSTLPKVVDFAERGTEEGGAETDPEHVIVFKDESGTEVTVRLTDDDIEAAKRLGQGRQQYAEVLSGRKAAKVVVATTK